MTDTRVRSFIVTLDAPVGTDHRGLLRDILDIGWDTITDRRDDEGWQTAHPFLLGKGADPDHLYVSVTSVEPTDEG